VRNHAVPHCGAAATAWDQKQFFEHYLYRGAIAFCDAVSASDKARFYRHVAAFTRAFLDVEREAFEIGG
jgi:TorA maturation chaperone TorD